MKTVNMLFLEALRASLEKRTVVWETELTPVQWQELFAVAAAHHVLPMIYEAVARSSAAKKADPQVFAEIKKQSMQLVMLQTRKSAAFLKLLESLGCAGLSPLVIKGIICREQYPKPDYRISADEDVLIPESQFALYHETLLANGMVLADPEWNMKSHEIPYIQKGNLLFIDLHRRLFPDDGEAYDEINSIFDGVYNRAITQTIQGVRVCTMNHTEHLLFLICHSFKHFVSCGVGIRQICDICLYANAFGSQIDWSHIMKHCGDIHADVFAATIFRIGEKYLTFQPETACYPDRWRMLEMDERAMLEDLFDAGIYGKSSVSREYSGHLTKNAFTDPRNEQNRGMGILKSVFPSVEYLSGRYPYLEHKPYLLPVAWADRILKYKKRTAENASGNSAVESIRIGNERIELLKQYGIIER